MGDTMARVTFCRECPTLTAGKQRACGACGSTEVVGATTSDCRPEDAQVIPVEDGEDIVRCGSRFHHADTGQDVRTDDWPSS